MSSRRIGMFVGLIFLAGCSGVPNAGTEGCATRGETPNSKWNFVIADENGGLVPFSDGQGRSQFDVIKENIVSSHKDVLIFAHGGLVAEADIRGRAEKLETVMSDDVLPIFLIWRTGPLETYADELSYRSNSDKIDGLPFEAPFRIVEDLTRGIVRAPTILALQIHRVANIAVGADRYKITDGGANFPQVSRYCGRRKAVDRGNNVIYPCRSEEIWQQKCGDLSDDTKDSEAKKYCEEPDRRDWSDESAQYLASTPARLPLSPIINGLGQSGWTNMLRRTRNTVRHAGEYNPRCMRDGELREGMAAYPEGFGAFSRLFAALRGLKAELRKDGRPDFRLILVGHSMGAIVLDELLLAYPNLGYDDIVYMGAAASITEVTRSITPVLRDRESNPHARFYNLMLHPEAEAREINYFGTVPSGSLLKWVDEVYGNPLTPRDKTAGSWDNVRAAKMAFPADIQERTIFKVFGQTDDDPLKHSDFVKRFCFWDRNFWLSSDFADDSWPGMPLRSKAKYDACTSGVRALGLD